MKIIFGNMLIALMLFQFAGCSEWTETEVLEPKTYDELLAREENGELSAYYASLREYKKSEHPVCFGWYSAWNPQPSTTISGETYLTSLPDSMDIVSFWEGDLVDMTEFEKKDLQIAREEKGLRVLLCSFTMNIGDKFTPDDADKGVYWGYDTGDWEGACRRYAKAFADRVIEYGYDGFDIDFEPNYGYAGNLASNPQYMEWFIDELSKYLGPKSGSGLLLVVDGEPQTLNAACGPCLDYYIIQAYTTTDTQNTTARNSDVNLDRRFKTLRSKFENVESIETTLKKLIWTENFEPVYLRDGGGPFNKRNGGEVRALRGMAEWRCQECLEVPVGGVGGFKFNLIYDRKPSGYSGNDPYYYLREAIQILNPAQTGKGE